MAGKFEPKEPVQLNPPKNDPISQEELSQATGKFWGACHSELQYIALREKHIDDHTSWRLLDNYMVLSTAESASRA